MSIFANPYPKAHEEESPIKIKAQRPTKKTKEQERSREGSARESDLQQNYKSAVEYKSVAEYSSSVEWLRQIKTNCA